MTHILLVDDDPLVLLVTGLILRKGGHTVTTAGSARVALEVLASDTACDMLITDHSMPEVSGTELIEQALQQRPDLPALIISGYARTQDWPELPPRVALLRKPFSRDDVLAWVAGQEAAPMIAHRPAPVTARGTHASRDAVLAWVAGKGAAPLTAGASAAVMAHEARAVTGSTA